MENKEDPSFSLASESHKLIINHLSKRSKSVRNALFLPLGKKSSRCGSVRVDSVSIVLVICWKVGHWKVKSC